MQSPAASAPAAVPTGRDVFPPADGARERVVQEIIAGLYEGRFEPGQRLVEAQLTATLNISRGPIREAFNSLAAMGIVDLMIQRGAHIRALTVKEAIDILVVAQALTAIAARHAAQNSCGDQPQRIKHALDALESYAASDTTARYAKVRDSFYGALVSLSGNGELRRVLPVLQIHLIRVQFRSILRKGDDRRFADYKRIAAAVIDGNAGAAEAAIKKHFQVAIDALAAYRLADR